MSAVNLSIDGERRLGVSAGALSESALEELEEIIDGIADAVEETIFTSWPVDTGRSLRAWRVFVDGLNLIIENPVEYASWVHPKGTKHQGDDLGISAEMVETAAEQGWQQKEGRMRRIVEGDVEGSLLGDAVSAAATRAAVRLAGVSELPGGELFTALREQFTLSAITSRESGRQQRRRRA